jgi:aryl-alcohol dehydrogenase-like predicted oxidoreductase
MEKRKLGGLEVSALGLGCMGMSAWYGPTNEVESLATLERALELGLNFLDTADIYGPSGGENEKLVGRFLAGKRDQIVLATKFGIVSGERRQERMYDARPEYVKAACEASLLRLKTDVIDLYYLHRLDLEVPIEDTVGAMSELVSEGKVRYLGLSEVSSANIHKAHAIHPITALQSEYSLWSRDVELEVLPTLKELGIGFVPYSPLGRGLLTGSISSIAELTEGDFRQSQPRFQGDNMAHNLELVHIVKSVAEKHQATAAQVALAWVLVRGEDFVPIPGTKRVKYLEDNVASLEVQLTPEDMEKLEGIARQVAGSRYPEASMKRLTLS